MLTSQVFRPASQRLPGRPLLFDRDGACSAGSSMRAGLSAGLATCQPRHRASLRSPLARAGALLALLRRPPVLPRLYPWFHQGLQLGAFLSALTALDAGPSTADAEHRSAESAIRCATAWDSSASRHHLCSGQPVGWVACGLTASQLHP